MDAHKHANLTGRRRLRSGKGNFRLRGCRVRSRRVCANGGRGRTRLDRCREPVLEQSEQLGIRGGATEWGRVVFSFGHFEQVHDQ